MMDHVSAFQMANLRTEMSFALVLEKRLWSCVFPNNPGHILNPRRALHLCRGSSSSCTVVLKLDPG